MSGSGKTVFVTGGGGYVASHSIIELLKDDFTVVAVDNFVNSIKGKFWANTAVALFVSDLQIPSIIFWKQIKHCTVSIIVFERCVKNLCQFFYPWFAVL